MFELVHAILTPPQLKRFREITGVTEPDAELEVDFEGWSKLALFTKDRVFLFPRRGRDEALLFSADACDALVELGVACVPRVIARWNDDALGVGPVVAFEREPGAMWSALQRDASFDDVSRVLASLGTTIATWHRLRVAHLPASLRRDARIEATRKVRAFLDPSTMEATVAAAAPYLDVSPDLVVDVLRPLAAMSPVLVHGDVWEGQFFVNDRLDVTMVLDWDATGIAHPLHDFDFSEWGFAIFEWEPQFLELRRAMWRGYADGLGAAAASTLPRAEAAHLAFTLADLVHFERASSDGTLDAWGSRRLAACRAAIGSAIAAARP